MRTTCKAIVYIGEFDLRNENVQAHLVKNNGKILNKLGYSVFFVGTNRKCFSFNDVNKLNAIKIENGGFLELPHTLTVMGFFRFAQVKKKIMSYLAKISETQEIKYVITYQAPTYACILKNIALWCMDRKIPYIVNCADLPIFDNQPLLKRLMMGINWNRLHKINKLYADGIISVSKYIANFYRKENRPCAIIPPLFDEPKLEIKETENDIPVFLYAGTPFIKSAHEIKTTGMKDRLDKIVDLMLDIEKRGILFQFDIVGISKEDYCTCVPRHNEMLNKSRQIAFYGKQSHENTLKKLVDADYMINYRDKNLMTEAGLSTKVVESVSVGTPVIMNDIGDTFLYLENGVSGIKLTGDFDKDVGLVSKLCQMNKVDRKRNKSVSKNSKVFSLDKYTSVMQHFLDTVHSH